jgi:long-chain fatty acid transport protein
MVGIRVTMRHAIVGFSGCLLLFILSPNNLHAQTPRIQSQGAAAAGMGNAFTAQANDPSALYYNPAGITQLSGVQTMFGALAVGGTTNFTSPTGATATGDRGGSVAWPPPAHVYLTANFGDLGITSLSGLTAGIGLISPFGSLTRYPEDGPFRTATTFTTLPLIDIKPTLAYKVNDQLSIGLGTDIYTFSSLFGEGHVEKQSIWPGGFGIPAGSKVELYGRDTAAGFNASLLYTPLRNAAGKPIANIGLVYRSQATLHLTGALLANGGSVSNATATLVLPQVFSAGIAIWPIRDDEHEWKLGVDIDYVGWKSVKNLDVHLANGATIPQPQNWRGAYNIMIGTEYRWLRLHALREWEVALRAGYINQQTQMPDLTFDPGIPSADVHIPTIGLGLLCKANGSFLGLKCGAIGVGPLKPKAIGLDLSYQAALYEDRTITGNRNPTVNGVYRSVFHLGGVSVRFLF